MRIQIGNIKPFNYSAIPNAYSSNPLLETRRF